MVFTISVLGPIELRHDGELVPVPSGKATEVLIRLAIDVGVIVHAERLIEDLWGAKADTTARNTLQAKVSSLRRALGPAAVVSGGRGGYRLLDRVRAFALARLRVPGAAGAAHAAHAAWFGEVAGRAVAEQQGPQQLRHLIVARVERANIDAALVSLAAVAAVAGQLDDATGLLNSADAMMSSAGHRLTDLDRLDARRARSLLHPAVTNSASSVAEPAP